MKLFVAAVLSWTVFLTFSVAEARVFDFSRASMATYFKFAAGPSMINLSPYEFSGGSNLTYGDKYNYNYFGELGLLIAAGKVNIRLGVDFVRPSTVVKAAAKDVAGTTLYELNSSMIGVGGVLGVDIVLGGAPQSHYYVTMSGGLSRVTLKNEYLLTTDGRTAYNVIDYIEEGSGTSYFGQAGLGLEFLVTDNVTFSMEGGYRYQFVQNMKHERPHQTVNGATIGVGDAMQDSDGKDRVLNLSGAFIGASFRFYVNF